MKRFTQVFAVLISVITLAISIASLGVSINKDKDVVEPLAVPPLSFNEDGTFKILHLTDFHEWMGIEKAIGIDERDTLKPLLENFIRTSVKEHNPDLIILGGDNIFSLSAIADTVNGISLKTYRTIAQLFEELNVYWTFTFGNHDAESTNTKYSFINEVASFPHFVGGLKDGSAYHSFVLEAQNGEADYVSNFSIPIYSLEDGNYEIKYNVFVLDSGSYEYVNKTDGYRSIRPEQSTWYESEVRLHPEVPSVMFSHIPFPECDTAFLNGGGTGFYAGISPSCEESDILSTVLALKNTKATFFGHNHANSWTGFLEDENYKLMMGVTPAAQAQSYDDTTSIMSGRIVELNSNGSLKTFVFNSDSTSEDECEVTVYN